LLSFSELPIPELSYDVVDQVSQKGGFLSHLNIEIGSIGYELDDPLMAAVLSFAGLMVQVVVH
jgi:hypothetical protein